MTTRGRIGQAVTGLVLAAAGVVLLVELAEPPRVPVSDPLGPHGVPRVLAGGLVLIGVLLLATAWRHREPSGTGESEPTTATPGWLLTTLTVAATAGYVVALTRLGFVLATALLGFLLLPLLGARRWYTVIGVPVGLTATLWFLFGYVLDVGLPGFLGRY